MADTEQPISPRPQPTPSPDKPALKPEMKRYTLIPFPKIVFFYPLMFVALAAGTIQAIKGVSPSYIAGTLFILMFLLNILVISFDFPGVKALALALGLIAVVFGVILFNIQVYPILGPLKTITERLAKLLHASAAFYFVISAILFCMIMGGILGNILWNRWTIEPNRLKHKDGLFSFREYPVIDLQVDKEVEDIFEYILLGSGTLTFRIPNNNFRLENVPRISSAERKIQYIVRQLRVKSE